MIRSKHLSIVLFVVSALLLSPEATAAQAVPKSDALLHAAQDSSLPTPDHVGVGSADCEAQYAPHEYRPHLSDGRTPPPAGAGTGAPSHASPGMLDCPRVAWRWISDTVAEACILSEQYEFTWYFVIFSSTTTRCDYENCGIYGLSAVKASWMKL